MISSPPRPAPSYHCEAYNVAISLNDLSGMSESHSRTRWSGFAKRLGMLLFLAILPLQFVLAASLPKELKQVIDAFMDLESTSVEIKQVIDWRFSSDSDTVRIQMDIKGDRNFHVMLAGFGMEIFVTEDEMITLNHIRQQVLYENASADALLKQLFVGGDLNQARFKSSKDLKNGSRRLNFRFDDDFSDWESLSVILNSSEVLERLILVDYDGNRYIISLTYLAEFEDFQVPKVDEDYLHYQIADLREN